MKSKNFQTNSRLSNQSGQVEVGVKEVPTKLMLDFICKYKSGIPRPSEDNSESAFIPKEEVLDLITAPAIIERYKAFLEYVGRPIYLEYVTKPVFELKLKRLI